LIEQYYTGEHLKLQEQASQQYRPEDAEVPLERQLYASAQDCMACHQEAYGRWQSSAHARAVQTLRQKKRLVAECLACHSEEYRRTGYFDPNHVLPDDGVSCSTCHGEGRIHSLTGQKQFITRSMRAEACIDCHNPEQQIKAFDYDQALQRIRHW